MEVQAKVFSHHFSVQFELFSARNFHIIELTNGQFLVFRNQHLWVHFRRVEFGSANIIVLSFSRFSAALPSGRQPAVV